MNYYYFTMMLLLGSPLGITTTLEHFVPCSSTNGSLYWVDALGSPLPANDRVHPFIIIDQEDDAWPFRSFLFLRCLVAVWLLIVVSNVT